MVFVSIPQLKSSKDENHPSLLVFEKLLASQSLSDLCLKIYFSQDYSDAEFISVNTALTCIDPCYPEQWLPANAECSIDL